MTIPDIGNKISVCLLTYNHVGVIESTLKSILDQTVHNYDIVVSDDCSTDGTWERILEVAKTDARIRPLQTPHNLKMPGNANFAVSQSDRPYIALLHHDDIYRKDLLEKWAENLECYPGVGFVFNPYDVSHAERIYGRKFENECLNGQWFLERCLFTHWGCPVRGTAMIRRTYWNKVGGMREQFDLVSDVDLWMRLSRISQVGYVPEPLISLRALRPDYYPELYNENRFNWRRKLLVYEIHASNRLSYFSQKTFEGKLQWWKFRLKLSCETLMWLCYGVVRKKRRNEILRCSAESVSTYDLWPLRIFRHMLQLMVGSTEC